MVRLRNQQLFQEDIHELSQVHELKQLEILAVFLREQSGSQLNYSNLATKLRISDQTIRLEAL